MKTPILFGDDNPDGLYLETVLDQLISEIEAKTKKIEGFEHPTLEHYRRTNALIMNSLKMCRNIQTGAIQNSKNNPVPADILEQIKNQLES